MAQAGGIRPVIDFSGMGLCYDPGHGSIRLPDAENGSAGAQVFEQFPRQRRPVFRFLTERQDQHGRVQLLPHGGQVIFIAQVDQLC